MPEIEQISWRELTGNKFVISLNPAMLSDAGYIRQQKIRKIGDVVPTIFNVEYDRDYAVERIGGRLCKNLFVLGKQGILELVAEAWDKQYPNATESAICAK